METAWRIHRMDEERLGIVCREMDHPRLAVVEPHDGAIMS
jgi:hypothetical protein